MCEECDTNFSTIEALEEHRRAEKEETKLRNAGLADGQPKFTASYWGGDAARNIISVQFHNN